MALECTPGPKPSSMRCREAPRSSAWRRSTACARHDSFARRFIAGETVEEAIETVAPLQAQGLQLTLDYLGESVRTSKEADCGDTRVRPAARRDRRIRHRTQHLAEADAARRGRRSRHVRRQHAAHPRAGRPPRVLRAHRHGELAVDAADARCLRDAVAAGVSQHRHRAAGGAVPHRAGRAAHERAWRARPAGQGRLQGAADGGVSARRQTSTRRSSGSCAAARPRQRIRPSPRTTRR